MDWYVMGEYKFKFDFESNSFMVANDKFMLTSHIDDVEDRRTSYASVTDVLVKMLEKRINNLEVLR